MRPLLSFELCGIASTSQPMPASMQPALSSRHRPCGVGSSNVETGKGTFAVRKITLRCIVLPPAEREYS